MAFGQTWVNYSQIGIGSAAFGLGCFAESFVIETETATGIGTETAIEIVAFVRFVPGYLVESFAIGTSEACLGFAVPVSRFGIVKVALGTGCFGLLPYRRMIHPSGCHRSCSKLLVER